MIEINEKPLMESLRVCKARKYETNFIDPWKNPDLTRGKLIYIDYDNQTAEVQVDNQKTTVPITDNTFKLICEMGNTYGATAFIQDNVMINFSYQTLPVQNTNDGVDVYEI